MDVSVVFGQGRGLFADRSRALGLRVVDLGFRSGYDLRPSRLRRAAGELARADIVHAHGFNPPLAAIMLRAKRPIVFTEHGNFALGRRLGVTGAVKRPMQRRFLATQCAAIAANSRWTAERMSEIYGLDLARVAVVHNGIDAEGLAPTSQTRRRSGELVVAFIGRLVSFKRVDRILRAVARLRARDGVRVVIAGSGPLEGELHALARELGIDDNVQFLGWQSDIAKVLAETDVLVLPSTGEPFGLAVIEASAKGALPIVFADGGGVLECVPPDGRVVGGVDELAATLDQLRGSTSLAPAARNARSDWARRHFSISRTATDYLKLYQRAAKGSP